MDVDSEDALPTHTSTDEPSATLTSLRGPQAHDTGIAEPFVVEPPRTEPLIEKTLNIEPLIAGHSRIESPVSKLLTIQPATTKPLLTHRTDIPILLAEPPITKTLQIGPVFDGPLVKKPLNVEPPVTEPLVNETVVNESLVNEPLGTEPTITEPTITEPLVTTLPIAEPPMNKARPSDSNIGSFHPPIADAPAEDPYSASIWGKVLDICDHYLEKLAMEHAPQGAEEAVVVGDKEGMNNRVVLVEYLPNKEKRCIRIPASGWKGKWSELDQAQLTRCVHIMIYLKEKTQIPIPEIFHWDAELTNTIEAPYTIMSFINGIEPSELWWGDVFVKPPPSDDCDEKDGNKPDEKNEGGKQQVEEIPKDTQPPTAGTYQ